MKGFVRYFFTLPVRFYRKFISPYTLARCKYYPTCSQYAIDAVNKHGIIAGTLLAIWRLLRCNPWSKGGIDYVPDKIFVRRNKRL